MPIKDFSDLISTVEAIAGLHREAEALSAEAEALAAAAALFIAGEKERYNVKHGPLVFQWKGALYAANNDYGTPAVSVIHVVTT